MKRLGAGAVTAAVVLAGPVSAAFAHDDEKSPGPRVVADGLDNPRQLNWHQERDSLVVAEAGRGGPDCVDTRCVGPTGAVTLIEDPHRNAPTVSSIVEGLLSAAAPDGSFAEGPAGADATDVERQYVIAGYDPERFDITDPVARGGSMLVAGAEEDGEAYLIPYADLQAAEEELNPDGAQVDSNPYAVLYVDEDRWNSPDGYALVADAGANTVWKVDPDFEAQTGEEPPPYEITAWATWPTTGLADGADDPAGPAEFVPTSLTADEHGNVYVGGLGSNRPGEASVVKFSADGVELDRWDGFTAVTGVAVDDEHLYVSQLFGPTPPMPPGETPADEAPSTPGQVPGQVVVVHRYEEDAARYAIDVPLPAGLATGRHGTVYASVNSVAPAEGIPAGPQNPFGAVDGGEVWELDFSDAYPVDPAGLAEPSAQTEGGVPGAPAEEGDVPVPSVDQTLTGSELAGTGVDIECPEGVSCSYQPTMYDIDGDGFYDPLTADTSGNGVLDQNVVFAGNGQPLWLFDTNENSLPDMYGGDASADGVPDLWFVDANEDFAVDSYYYDAAVLNPPTVNTGGTTLIIDTGRIPLSPPNITAGLEAPLRGTRTSSDFCTTVNGVGFITTGFGCDNGALRL